MRHNYLQSAYVPDDEKSGYIEDVLASAEYARFLHHADILKYKMDECERAGLLTPALSIQCLAALQHAQYTQTYTRAMIAAYRLDTLIDTLPTYVAPKPVSGLFAKYFGKVVA